jgi:hypothetical protein
MLSSGVSIVQSMLPSIVCMISSGGRPTTVRRIRQPTVLSEVATWLNAKLLVTPAIHMFGHEDLFSDELPQVCFQKRQIASVLIAGIRLLSMTITLGTRSHAMGWCSLFAMLVISNGRNL